MYHITAFFFTSIVCLLFFIFKFNLVLYWRATVKAVSMCFGRCLARMNGREYDNTDYSKQGFVYSDDIYYEQNYGQLFKNYKEIKKTKQRFKMHKFKGTFTQAEKRLYIDPYLKILERNQAHVYVRIMELVAMHEELIIQENPTKRLTDEQRIIALNEIFDKAYNPHNPDRKVYASKLD